MLLVAITAILIEAPRSWRLGEISLPTRWVPGYAASNSARIFSQVKCGIVMDNGLTYVGTRKGLFEVRGDVAEAVDNLRGKDVFSLSLHAGRLLVGTRESAWLRETDGKWVMIADSRGAVSFASDGRIIFNRGLAGLHATADRGQTWLPLAAANAALIDAPYPQRVTLSQLALDLHTGAALVGPRNMPAYVYVISAVLIVLALSGILIRPTYLRFKRERRSST